MSSLVAVRCDESINDAVSCRICPKGLDILGKFNISCRVVNEPVGFSACARDRKIPNNKKLLQCIGILLVLKVVTKGQLNKCYKKHDASEGSFADIYLRTEAINFLSRPLPPSPCSLSRPHSLFLFPRVPHLLSRFLPRSLSTSQTSMLTQDRENVKFEVERFPRMIFAVSEIGGKGCFVYSPDS